MRRAFALIGALLLGSCSFGSTSALFREEETTRPFADGAQFIVSDHSQPGPDEETSTVTLAWRDGAYSLIGADDVSWDGIQFVAVSSTPEEDYIAQLPVNEESSYWDYIFVWRSGEQYKGVVAPSLLAESEDGVLDQPCEPSQLGGCTFATRADLLAFYDAVIYPRFVAVDSDLHGLMYWTPVNRELTRPAE